MMDFKTGDVVQFTERHQWCGCIGIINEVKSCQEDVRYMVGIPIPSGDGVNTAYIFSMENKKEFEYVGRAVLMNSDL